MPRIPESLREEVATRARGLCEYCQAAQLIIVYIEIDHIQPESAGGQTYPDNLCLACRNCNSSKLDFETGIDPESGDEVALYNPRTQKWSEHFRWSDDGITLTGLTSTGRATIQRLRINRESIMISRRLWVEAGWHPPRDGSFPMD